MIDRIKPGRLRASWEALAPRLSPHPVQMLLAALLWLVMLSAMLIESYAYRYAGAILVFLAADLYFRHGERPKATLTTWLCVGWGIYALGRFALYYLVLPDHPMGERELLFVMPLAFPALALVLNWTWEILEAIIAVFFGAALAVLVLTAHFPAVFAGETVSPLIQHNQIHGAVCCGLLLIGAMMWMLHYRTAASEKPGLKLYSTLGCVAIAVFCIIAIYGAKSKGVWLALGLVSPAVVFVVTRYLKPRTAAIAIVLIACVLASGIYIVRDNIYRTAGPTAIAAAAMFRQAGTDDQIGSAVGETIGNSATPVSMNERLQLWSNAWDLFTAAPIFGWGNEWTEQWPLGHYHVNYTIMHNGYLEILVRHGLFGAVVFALILALMCRSVYRAARLSVIPRAAMHAYFLFVLFFAFTLLSNSNNRLAMGESLMLLSSAFALVCEFRCRSHGPRADTGDLKSGAFADHRSL